MRRTPLLIIAVLVATALTAAGCAQESDDDVSVLLGGSGGGSDGAIAPDTGLDGRDAPSADEVVTAALDDVNAYWQRTYQDLYGDAYVPIQGGYWPYGPSTEQPPCGEPRPSYGDIADNAFYCPGDDLIAWDADQLIPDLYDSFGGFTIGIVFAHEFGHAIQERARVAGPTILLELQADCFAGAWTGDVEAGNANHFELDLTDLDKAIGGFLELRDGVGADAADPAAHGTGFDRIGAFIEGYEQGAARCVEYPGMLTSGELVIVETPFTDQQDYDRGGNLPLDELAQALFPDLEDFWTTLFSELGQTWTPVSDIVGFDPAVDEVTCGGETYRGDQLVDAAFYCIPSDTIYYDRANLVPALNQIGDYAVATELARQYAYAAQVRLGNESNDLASNLQADCYTGLYAYSGFSGNRGDTQQLVLSPGDLDEAIISFLYDSDSPDTVDAGDGTVGTAFDRVKAYRAGFLGGTDACDALLDG